MPHGHGHGGRSFGRSRGFGGYGRRGYGGGFPLIVPVPYPYSPYPYYYSKEDDDEYFNDNEYLNEYFDINENLVEESYEDTYDFSSGSDVGDVLELAPGVYGEIIEKEMDYEESDDIIDNVEDEQIRNYLALTVLVGDTEVTITNKDADNKSESTFNVDGIDYYVYGNNKNDDYTLGYTVCRIVAV